jgi:hypothetical protein
LAAGWGLCACNSVLACRPRDGGCVHVTVSWRAGHGRAIFVWVQHFAVWAPSMVGLHLLGLPLWQSCYLKQNNMALGAYPAFLCVRAYLVCTLWVVPVHKFHPICCNLLASIETHQPNQCMEWSANAGSLRNGSQLQWLTRNHPSNHPKLSYYYYYTASGQKTKSKHYVSPDNTESGH